MYAQRLRAAATATADAGLAGLVITAGYDLRYLIGSRAQTFERLTALVLPADGRADHGGSAAGTGLAEGVRRHRTRYRGAGLGGRRGPVPAGGRRARRCTPVATAVTDSMPALHLLPLADVLGVVPVLATDVLRRLRMIKDAGRDRRAAQGGRGHRPGARPGAGVPGARPHRGRRRR